MTKPVELTFGIVGLQPAHSKAANDFLSRLDLGITGAYVKLSEVGKITLKPGEVAKSDEHYCKILKSAYETLGCKDVFVWRIEE